MRLAALSRWRAVRKARGAARETRRLAAHALGLREDVAPPAAVERLRAADRDLRAAMKAGEPGAMGAAARRVGEAVQIVCPPKSHAVWRERMETLVVAAAVAMSIRTYFVQPFKIPTGSMQPTLNGVRIEDQSARRWMDIPPLSWVGWALFGEGYVEVKARRAGYLAEQALTVEDGMVVFVDGVGHRVRRNMKLRVNPGAPVARGTVLASGRVSMGDHIFVNKVRYNFTRPGRGDVFVFDTSLVKHPAIRNDSFYIKRLVGLPRETIRIEAPYLVADDRRVLDPYPFRRMVEDPEYPGYQPAAGSPRTEWKLGAGEYLPMGDNQPSSLDGRYFGAVPDRSIVGPAFWVYWPFTRHWGPIH
jgi:signal peptidase I